jgi:hypothetical protein
MRPDCDCGGFIFCRYGYLFKLLKRSVLSLIIFMCLFALGCGKKLNYMDAERAPFKVGEKVEFIDGFYSGCRGKLTEVRVYHGADILGNDDFLYIVQFSNCDGKRVGTVGSKHLKKRNK